MYCTLQPPLVKALSLCPLLTRRDKVYALAAFPSSLTVVLSIHVSTKPLRVVMKMQAQLRVLEKKSKKGVPK